VARSLAMSAAAAAAAATPLDPLMLVLDTRERGRDGRPGLVEALTAYLQRYNATLPAGARPLAFSVEALAVGDIVARRRDGTPADVVERKTLTDMGSTLAPGQGGAQRYRSQKESMKKARDDDGASLCYLFEVPRMQRGFMDPTNTAARFAPTSVSAASLRGMVWNTRVRDRIETDFSEDMHETARWIVARFQALARFDHVVGSETPAKRRAVPALDAPRVLDGDGDGDGDATEMRQLVVTAKRKRKEEGATPATRTADALLAVPLVGPADALQLAAHFGSVAALCARLPAAGAQDYRALAKELRTLFGEIKGIGEKTAVALYTTLRACEAPAKPAPVKRAPREAAAAPGAAPPVKKARAHSAGALPPALLAARLAPRPAGTARRPIELEGDGDGDCDEEHEPFGDAPAE